MKFSQKCKSKQKVVHVHFWVVFLVRLPLIPSPFLDIQKAVVCEFCAFCQSINHSIRTIEHYCARPWERLYARDKNEFHMVSASGRLLVSVCKDEVIKHSEHRRGNVIEVQCQSSEERLRVREVQGRWAFTWIMNPEEHLKLRKRELYTKHGRYQKQWHREGK